MISEDDHEGHDKHQSVMRGVCYCKESNTLWCNPRLFRTGEMSLSEFSGEDWEAIEVCQSILSAWWPHLEDKEFATTDNATVMPGMVCELPQVPGNAGFELFARMS